MIVCSRFFLFYFCIVAGSLCRVSIGVVEIMRFYNRFNFLNKYCAIYFILKAMKENFIGCII